MTHKFDEHDHWERANCGIESMYTFDERRRRRRQQQPHCQSVFHQRKFIHTLIWFSLKNLIVMQTPVNVTRLSLRHSYASHTRIHWPLICVYLQQCGSIKRHTGTWREKNRATTPMTKKCTHTKSFPSTKWQLAFAMRARDSSTMTRWRTNIWYMDFLLVGCLFAIRLCNSSRRYSICFASSASCIYIFWRDTSTISSGKRWCERARARTGGRWQCDLRACVCV